jgi:glutamate/tyrosine decarboxylase-like PLP-dependent enzyme
LKLIGPFPGEMSKLSSLSPYLILIDLIQNMQNSEDNIEKWLTKTQILLGQYLQQNGDPDSKVVRYSPPLELKEVIDFSLGSPQPEEVIWDYIKVVLEKSVRTTHPLFLNQLFGGYHPEAISAEWISTVLNPTMATFEVAPLMTILEKEVSRKLSNLMGLKLGEGIMVTGGSNANLVGLLCARQFKVPDVKKRGYQGKKYTVYISSEAHYSYEKAIHISGLGIDHLRSVKVDQNGAMDPSILKQMIKQDIAQGFIPLMIGATAGTTVLGAFDPISEINKIAREHNLWLHVDAAWGGGAIFSPSHRHLLKGIHLADSITFDAHKTLNTGLIASFILCKHPGMLKQTNQGGGNEYIFHDYDNSDWDTGTYSLQCGRRPDILKLWLLWKSRGDVGMAKIIDHLFELSAYTKEKIESNPRFKLISSQYLNNCFQILPPNELVDINQYTLKVRTHLVQNGRALVNYVELPNKTIFFRVVAANNQTKKEDLDVLFNEINKSIQAIDAIS